MGFFCAMKRARSASAKTRSPATKSGKISAPVSRLKKLELLLEFDLKIAKSASLDHLLELLAEETRQLLEADRCTVFLFDKRSKLLWSKVAHGLGGGVLRIPTDAGLVGAAFSSGRILNIEDAYKDPRFSASTDQQTGYRTRTVLAVPMHDSRKKEVLGVFQVLNKGRGRFDREDEELLTVLADHAAAAVEKMQLYTELRRAQEETVMRLGLMAEYRDPKDTAGHLKRMSAYSAIIALQLGWSAEDAETLRLAASLHDIGKVATPDVVLLKTGKLSPTELGAVEYRLAWWAEKLKLDGAGAAEIQKVAAVLADIREANKPSSTEMPKELEARIRALISQRMIDSDGQEKPLLTEDEIKKLTIKRGNLTPEERREMEKHTLYGAKMLENAQSALLQMAEMVTRSHHERFDGNGYPFGLKGEAIPVEGRIVALADVFDALISKRVYKAGWSLDEVLDFVKRESGKHFDPKIVDAFLRALPKIQEALTRFIEEPDIPVR